jgi:mannose-6-phosphate isomerase
MLYPLKFRPILKERVWGGRKLEELYKKTLPPGVPIGESWEISDRPGDISVIAEGQHQGRDLHWLIENHAREVLGNAASQNGRFPLLIKILDARETLSLQVHPPQRIAQRLAGEPKTEMWYIAQAEPGAHLFAGLKRGVTRTEFEAHSNAGKVAKCFHKIDVQAGDALFLPSGRVHAIGAGLVIFETQQNSDTTYRVYDWDRQGLDGKPRPLHVHEALESIDFEDFEPGLVVPRTRETPFGAVSVLVTDPLFTVEKWDLQPGATISLQAGRMHIFGTISAKIEVSSDDGKCRLEAGEFCLVPAGVETGVMSVEDGGSILHTTVSED